MGKFSINHSGLAGPDPRARQIYRSIAGRKVLFLLAIIPALGCSFLVDIMTGAASLSAGQVITAIFSPESTTRSVQVIIWTMRLPIAVRQFCRTPSNEPAVDSLRIVRSISRLRSEV